MLSDYFFRNGKTNGSLPKTIKIRLHMDSFKNKEKNLGRGTVLLSHIGAFSSFS